MRTLGASASDLETAARGANLTGVRDTDLLPSEPQEVPPVSTIDEPRAFEIEELFFSTTDSKGHIETANEVFFRVSGFAPAELIGEPHNIIRHPDVPRVVFQLLWDEIGAGRQIVAYVKNRAKDGRYYWVVALITPIEGGYLSVRFKPSSELYAAVQNLYCELRQVESAIENAGQGKPAAMAAAREALDAKLGSLGFSDYRDFMYRAFERELGSRETELKKRGTKRHRRLEPQGQSVTAGVGGSAASDVVESCHTALTALDSLFHEMGACYKLDDGIRSKSKFVTSLSESIRILSLNGALETERLGTTGSGLGKVMDWLQHFSRDIALGCDDLTQSFARLNSEIRSAAFELGSAKLQIEMTTDFAMEILRRETGARQTGANADIPPGVMQDLYRSSSGAVKAALATLVAVERNLRTLGRFQESLWKSIRSLRLIYLKGKVELASVASERLAIIFDNMNQQLTDAETNLGALDCLVQELAEELRRGVELSGPVEQAVAKIVPSAGRTAP